MNAVINISGMQFYSHHGCFEEERTIGTRFVVDLTLSYDATKAALTDNVEDAVNYALVYQTVKREMMSPSHLLENVATRIIRAIKTEYPAVQRVKVKVCKLNPPLGGQLDFASVEVEE